MSARSDYLEWKRRNLAVACLFARMIANRPGDYGQHMAEVNASTSANRIAEGIARAVDRLLTDADVVAATILLPKVDSLPKLAEGLWALRHKTGWAVTSARLNHPPVGTVATVALTRQIPNGGGGMLPSEVLAFGPFSDLPATRRAPVAAIELFVGIPMAQDPKPPHDPPTKVNLAHIETPNLSADAYASMTTRTGKSRRKSLGLSLDEGATDQDLRAKAKVTLVLPEAIAVQLGILPP